MKSLLFIMSIGIFTVGCGISESETGWEISVLPSSVRLDPETNEIIDQRFDAVIQGNSMDKDLLEKNWIYDGAAVPAGRAQLRSLFLRA